MSLLGIGLDTAYINRFVLWQQKSLKSLSRIFSAQEITYSLANKHISAERFAIRFATKEAFFKAVQPLLVKSIPLLLVCRNVSISKNLRGVPELMVRWSELKAYLLPIQVEKLRCHITLSHTRCCASALVVLEIID